MTNAELHGCAFKGWQCFHCGEVFTTQGGAAAHFGADPEKSPGCMIRVQLGGERGLLMKLREVEAERDALTGKKPPHDAEEFISEFTDTVLVERDGGDDPTLVIFPDDLRAWMTGHVRVPVESFDLMKETLEMIIAADWRKWEELSSPDEFVRWAKSRANHALSMLNASKGEQ